MFHFLKEVSKKFVGLFSNTTFGRISFVLEVNLSGDIGMVTIFVYSVGCHCVRKRS